MPLQRPPRPKRRSAPELTLQPEITLETRILTVLTQLEELKGTVDASLAQGRENVSELRMLRKELGLDGPHGRLPLVEATLAKFELRMDKQELRINELEAEKLEAEGRHKLLSTVTSLCGGGAGGAAITLIAHLLRNGF